MDIPSLSTALSQAKVAQQVGVSLLSIGKELMLQQGAALDKLISSTDVSLMERSIMPHVGGNIDIKL